MKKIRNIYIIYISILLSVLLFYTMFVFRSLEIYQLSDSSFVIADIVSSLKNYNPYSVGLENDVTESSANVTNNASSKSKHAHQEVTYSFDADYSDIIINAYENEDDYLIFLADLITNGDLSYKEISSDNEYNKVYGIYSNDVQIFTVNLTGTVKGKRLGMPIYDWTPESSDKGCKLHAVNIDNLYAVTITVPEDYNVIINGIELQASDVSGANITIPDNLIKTSKNANIPGIAAYNLSGFYKEPDISIKHLDKEIDTCVITGSNITAAYESFGINDSVKSIVKDTVTTYEKENFENSHIEISFDENGFSNYTVYSNACFSCKVAYEIHSKFGGEETTQKKEMTFYFVWDYVDDIYRIVDAQ